MSCIHSDKIFKKHDSAGRIYCLKKCLSCGADRGMCKRPFNLDSIPFLSEEEEKRLNKLRSDRANQEYYLKRSKEKEEFFKEYNIYLNSEKWKQKRELVLKRDNNLCQACLIEKANQVHHISYRHVYDEPLFELQSICKICHEKLHNYNQKSIYIELGIS